MRYNKTIRSETREAWNKNGMDAGGVLFFLVARAVCACIYLMVLLLLGVRWLPGLSVYLLCYDANDEEWNQTCYRLLP